MTLAREPVPPTPRKGFTPAQRAAVVEAQQGLCEVCSDPLGERYEVDHRLALFQGGKHEPSNWRAIHVACHVAKTAVDAGTSAKIRRLIAKADPSTRKAKRQIPARPFNPALRRKFDGTVERRGAS